MPTQRVIQVGTGGMGGAWCKRFLPPYVDEGRIEVVGAVDIDPDAHGNAKDHLGLSGAQCYTDVEEAFAELEADWCSIVVPPWHHEDVLDAALANDLDVLCEKPMAEDLEAAVRMVEKVENSESKMGVTMNHRFRQDLTSFRRALSGEDPTDLDYFTAAFTCNYREFGTMGEFRYEMGHPLLLDCAIHHLDFLADLTGGQCDRLYAESWNDGSGDFAGATKALVTMHFDNGVRGTFEGSLSNASTLHGWDHEYVRAECRDQTLVLSDYEIERHPAATANASEGDGEPVPLLERERWMHEWVIEQFLDWIDGGDPMATHGKANLQSMALVGGAIESAERGEAVDPQALITEAREDVSV
jgi:predicted dehydrogenase